MDTPLDFDRLDEALAINKRIRKLDEMFGSDAEPGKYGTYYPVSRQAQKIRHALFVERDNLIEAVASTIH